MITVYLLTGSSLILIFIVIAISLISKVRSVQRRKALEQPRESCASGLALVRYVQLNRQCSEAGAYQRLASFVKQHLSSEGASSIEQMATHDKQCLLQLAQGLLVPDPDAIDKI